ncbi:hypothetical protein CLOM_g16416 [Closterium sp. NIES-68]|nr:hypothetical protein CLOM_g16416 [Closterium sp. NIES-68]
MAIAGLDVYLALAGRVRRQFPYADSVWLSSEMQSVIDSTKHYTRWLFHATDFPRQALGESMDAYDARWRASGHRKCLRESSYICGC